MTERREYDGQTKAEVMAALLAGQSVSKVAEEYKINPSTVRAWKSRQLNGAGVAIVATKKKEMIGDLMLDCVEAQLVAIKAMADVFKEPDWIRKQTASEIAVLFGVISDKTYRILEALPDQADASE